MPSLLLHVIIEIYRIAGVLLSIDDLFMSIAKKGVVCIEWLGKVFLKNCPKNQGGAG